MRYIRIYQEEETCNAAAAHPPAAPVSALESIILPEMACERSPRSSAVMQRLTSAKLVKQRASSVADSINYFMLERPQMVDGLRVVAIMAFDETNAFPFRRAPGTSPGPTLGFVTTSPESDIAAWRSRHPGDLSVEPTSTNTRGGRDVFCRRFDE